MQRGKVIHYNQTEGKGTVMLDGQQYAFSVQQWQGNEAPAINRAAKLDRPAAATGACAPLLYFQGAGKAAKL